MFDVSPWAGLSGDGGVGNRTLFLAVCRANDVSPEKLRSTQRTAGLVRVRRRAARALRDNGCSLTEIGRLLCRHHTTVMNLLEDRP